MKRVGPYKVTVMECPQCKESLRVVTMPDGRQSAIERKTGNDHLCWDLLPAGAELLVMEDD